MGEAGGVRSVCAIACLLAASSSALAVQVLDQAYEPNSGIGYSVIFDQDVAQVFTVGQTGQLTRIEILVGWSLFRPPPESLEISLLPTVGGTPINDDAAALASVSVTTAQVAESPGQYLAIDLSPFSLFVQAGDAYAITLQSDAVLSVGSYFSIFTWSNAVDPYPGGDAHLRRSSPTDPTPDQWRTSISVLHSDLGFRTYVAFAVPEPASGLMVMLGLVALAHRRMCSRGKNPASSSGSG